MDETRTQKLWRIFKEWLATEKAVVRMMSTAEKQVLAIIVAVVAVFAIAGALLWSSIARASDQITVSVTCPKEFNFCYGNKAQFQEIMEFNQAMAKEIVKRQSCKNSI